MRSSHLYLSPLVERCRSISYPPPDLAFGEPDDRLQRVSSTPQLLGSIELLWILDHPLSRVMTP